MNIYTIKNCHGLKANISDYGARVLSLYVPDKKGHLADVVLGYDTIAEYFTSNEIYYGATIGRYGNRIGNAKFKIDEKEYLLAKNNGENNLHGGIHGFHKVYWNVNQLNSQTLEMSYFSKDMEEGFPGKLSVKLVYRLTDDNELKIEYFATTDKTTIVNLTHHSFFNLTGNPLNSINKHILYLNSDFYTPINNSLIPTGELKTVTDTPFDFRTPIAIGKRLHEKNEQLQFAKGYDHNWVIKQEGNDKNITIAAKVEDPKTGRVMEVHTNEPGIQFYGGNFLNGSDVGKNKIAYKFQTAFCLETQHFPNSPNQANFPSTLLYPEDKYHSICIYKFSTK